MFARMGISIHRSLGRDAVYNPVDDLPIPCRVIVEHDALLQPDGADFEISEVGTTLEVLFADVGTPKRGSTFEVGEAVYRVERIQDNDRIFVKVVVNED
ncbi:MAG: hypothetical protein JEZ12_27150 [Desulfobacterium sp.]|nr:hypothetical protein [Desulfobacterium sp.]